MQEQLGSVANRAAGSELAEVIISLKRERTRYSELLTKLNDMGHRLHFTDYPVPESTQKSPSPDRPKEGFVADLENEAYRLQENNSDLTALIEKLEKLV